MNDLWLICNPRSKTCDDDLVAQIQTLFTKAGRNVTRTLRVGEDDLPDATSAAEARVPTIAILSGDGTISAVAQNLRGWEGELVVLPGGTMNLLSHALHGERKALEVTQAYVDGRGGTGPVPVIESDDLTAYSGIIVGPSSAWADVREDLRNLDVVAIGSDAAQAVAATFNEPGVRIEGLPDEFPAIYIEPRMDGIGAFGVQAENAGDLLAHGWAWLTGDFRNGPSVALDVRDAVTLTSASDSFDILVDGERREASNPETFRSAQSQVRFFSARGEAQWP